MPEASELDVYKVPQNARLMTSWVTTVLPILRRLDEHDGLRRAYVVEDTVLLSLGVTFANIDVTYALAGYGHRQSGTSYLGGVFGGSWVPPGRNVDSFSEAILEIIPAGVRRWVLACISLNPEIKRGECVPVQLILPTVVAGDVRQIGLYDLSNADILAT